MASDAARPNLGWPTKALYGLSSLGTATRGSLIGAVLFFYNRVLGVDAKAVSFAIFVSLLIDAFWDPVVGQISDGSHTRLGRRHPFIYAAVLPAAVCFALIFMPPLGWSDENLFVYLLATLVGARLLESLVEIPMASLLPELSRDYDERTSLGSWRYVFLAVVGRALATILAYGVFLKGTRAQPFGQMNLAGYAPYAVTVGMISIAVTVLSALATQRFVPYMHQPPRRRPGVADMLREFAAAAGDRNFLALAMSGFVFGIAVGITQGLLLYFLTDFWGLPSQALLQLGLWTIPGGLIGVTVAPAWARAMGKKRGCLIVFFIAIFSTTVPIGLRLLGVMPPNSSPWVLRILILDSIATGLLSTMGFIIVTSMLADVVEAVQVKTGRRSEGVLFAADSLLRKITTSFAGALPGILLTYVHYPKGAAPGHVPATVLTHLATIYLPLVTVLYLCSTSVLLIYRIDRKQHEDNLERIAESATLAEEADPELNPHLEPDIITRPA
ncbi:MAG TPA: MFS transporter [Caulobacteraceae bacterium]|nr:MFS transporter [Caulobacteraceae bacterium]